MEPALLNVASYNFWREFIYSNRLGFQDVGPSPPLFHPKFQGVAYALDGWGETCKGQRHLDNYSCSKFYFRRSPTYTTTVHQLYTRQTDGQHTLTLSAHHDIAYSAGENKKHKTLTRHCTKVLEGSLVVTLVWQIADRWCSMVNMVK